MGVLPGNLPRAMILIGISIQIAVNDEYIPSRLTLEYSAFLWQLKVGCPRHKPSWFPHAKITGRISTPRRNPTIPNRSPLGDINKYLLCSTSLQVGGKYDMRACGWQSILQHGSVGLPAGAEEEVCKCPHDSNDATERLRARADPRIAPQKSVSLQFDHHHAVPGHVIGKAVGEPAQVFFGPKVTR